MVATAEAADALREMEALTFEAERRGMVRPDFGAWLERRRPEFQWDAPHFRLMQDRLDGVTYGDIDRLLLQVAGRHGKTETVSSYVAYRLELDPSTRVLLVTYSQPQARKLSRQIRRMARDAGVELSAERDSVDEWETAEGGGVRAVGVGSGTASINADLIVIDDPIGNRAEAESAAHRERVWDAITTDILARCEPQTAVVFSMPRWHMDDPAGRTQDRQKGHWHIVDLPGRSLGEGDMLGRPEGEVLWPEERGEKWHETMRVSLGSFGYASFIQCRPTPRTGGTFEWDWWHILPEAPTCIRLVRYWDLAGTQPERGKNEPDYTVGTLAGEMADGRTVFLDQVAFQLSVGARDARMEAVAKADRGAYGQSVVVWFEKDTGVGGRDRTKALTRRLQGTGLAVYNEPATGSKEVRAEPLQSAAEAQNVVFGPDDEAEPWHDAFRLQAAEFPSGRFDDRVDSAAGAFNKITLNEPSSVSFASYGI